MAILNGISQGGDIAGMIAGPLASNVAVDPPSDEEIVGICTWLRTLADGIMGEVAA